MNNGRVIFLGKAIAHCLLILGMLSTAAVQAGSFNISVVDVNGAPITDTGFGFRWLLQEDTSFQLNRDLLTGEPVVDDPNILSFSFHKSYHPPARDFQTGAALKGNADGNTTLAPVTNVLDGYYYLSVLPYDGYSISGAPIQIDGALGTQTLTVTVQKHPIPTAQISMVLFHDNGTINGAPDLPEESAITDPLSSAFIDWTQFSLFLEEPAGRYGIAGGQVIQDAFGNPLGTSYVKTCDANGANPGTGTYGCFDTNGDPVVATLGDGTIHPLADGTMLVENLVPGKYGTIIIPPTGQNWQQTSTIEGSPVIDAWVKANEPPFFVEFGPPGPHVFVGFIRSTANGGFAAFPPGGTMVSGKILDTHLSRPIDTTFYPGRDFPDCWVGLNDGAVGGGPALYAGPCNGDSTFTIPDVPAGSYSLAIFDKNLDAIIAALPFTVDAVGGTCNNGGSCDLGDLAVFNWFTRLNTGIFKDDDQDGFWDAGEIGIGPESQDVSLRWRDGTIYQNFPTDNEGFAPFDETFPFFHWLVAEVSFANKKATGVTYVVDGGGPVLGDNGWVYPSFDELTPQAQCVDDGSGTGATVSYLTGGTCPTLADEDNNPNTSNNLSRTEQGPSLTTGFQGFQGQVSVMQFGKADYTVFDFSTSPFTFVGENGGISGIVFNTTTRAENEPQFAAAEEWEAGVPRVQVSLYADGDIDSFPLGDFPTGAGDIDWNDDGVLDGDDNIIDDVDGDLIATYADIDNYPLGFSECGDIDNNGMPDGGCTAALGPEDIDRDGDQLFDLGDAVQVTWTDSWDDSLPTGCQGETFFKFGDTSLPTDCYDGLRNFNQVRPAVFDGGYAFTDYDMAHLGAVRGGAIAADIMNFYDTVTTTLVAAANSDPAKLALIDSLQLGLLPGDYIVESATPAGYEHTKEEDRNVDFGDGYIPSPQALAVACVGNDHTVPALFSFATKDGSGDLAQIIPGWDPADNAAPFAGVIRPLCDRKKVPLSSGQNAAAEFFLMTDVPVAANASGITLNDIANEFDPNSPAFSEKFAPPWIPVAFYDWNGALLNRVYGDQFGRFNAMLASTFTANIGMPSGMSPNMILSCMNDPGPIPDGSGGMIIDPLYDPQYSQFCYTLQFMPGTITYLDTPVVSIAAFAGNGGFPVDCERPDTTPMIASATLTNGDGPYLVGGTAQGIQISSMGMTTVSNPEWDGTLATSKTIQRDYGFGAAQGLNGTVELVDASGTPIELTGITGWNNDIINVTVPATVPAGEYQIVVTSDYTGVLVENPLAQSPIGVTLTVGTGSDVVHTVDDDGPADFATIQDALNDATVSAGDLILVKPGTYDELVIMSKPVRLQGEGAGAVFLNARPIPTDKVQAWRNELAAQLAAGTITPLPGQEGTFQTEEGTGILVAGCNDTEPTCNTADTFAANPGARIDGFSILGSAQGGGIVLNSYAEGMVVSNNRLTGNAGALGGGLRVGNPLLTHTVADVNDPSYDANANNGAGNIDELVYDNAASDNVRIHHNHISTNGATSSAGAGAGISLHTGADDYRVQDNWICGNFTQGSGAGIAHLGTSDNGLIEDNFVIFNESFSQGFAKTGGGILIGGQAGLEPEVGTNLVLSPGTGNVTINSNQVRGNLAGAGDGGGISIRNVNGRDITESLGSTTPWYEVNVYNNFINNNVTALAGGGIAVQDALKVNIRNNTVANNDSTATANVNGAFATLPPSASEPQPAGIVSREHSATMLELVNIHVGAGAGVPVNWLAFSDPLLRDDIVLHNRSFYWANVDEPGTVVIETGLFPASCPRDAAGLPVDQADPQCDPATAILNDYSDDLAVMDGVFESTTFSLTANFAILTDTAADPGTDQYLGQAANLDFNNGYFNTDRKATLLFDEPGAAATAGAFDEGGNFLQVSYGPLGLIEPGVSPQSLFGYHLATQTFAINNGGYNGGVAELDVDYDDEPRPDLPQLNDIGADERLSTVPLADSDSDGVDDSVDNCTNVANPAQRDSNADGYGNMCDGDLDQSGFVDFGDLTLFSSAFFTADADADLNGDGFVDFGDMTIFSGMFFQAPGPSGLVP